MALGQYQSFTQAADRAFETSNPLPVTQLLQQGHAFYSSKQFITLGLCVQIQELWRQYSFRPPRSLIYVLMGFNR